MYSWFTLGFVDNRRITVIRERFVATRRAGTAGVGLAVADGHFPVPEWHLLGDVHGVIACVRAVAGATVPATLRLVHVEEVQIRGSIAEAGQALGLLGLDKLLVVTAEAEFLFLDREALIERFRVRLVEQRADLGSVNSMTPVAVAVADGTVLHLVGIQNRFHRRDRSVGELDQLIVTFEAHRQGVVL